MSYMEKKKRSSYEISRKLDMLFSDQESRVFVCRQRVLFVSDYDDVHVLNTDHLSKDRRRRQKYIFASRHDSS